MIKVKDLRTEADTEIGNAIETSGDHSMLFINTDKGYRLIIDAHNMKKITDYYEEKKLANQQVYSSNK